MPSTCARLKMTSSVRSPTSCRLTVTTRLPRFPTRSSPSRSKMYPRGGGTGTTRAPLFRACSRYCSEATTCTNHSRVPSAPNMNAHSTTKTLSRIPVFPSVISLPPEHPLRPRGLHHAAKHGEEDRGQHGIVESGQERHAHQEHELHLELPQQVLHQAVEQNAAGR